MLSIRVFFMLKIPINSEFISDAIDYLDKKLDITSPLLNNILTHKNLNFMRVALGLNKIIAKISIVY